MLSIIVSEQKLQCKQIDVLINMMNAKIAAPSSFEHVCLKLFLNFRILERADVKTSAQVLSFVVQSEQEIF